MPQQNLEIRIYKVDIEVLHHAKKRCMCESSYRYICPKCKDTGNGYILKREKSAHRLQEAGLVTRDPYHGLITTTTGNLILTKIRKK